MSLHYVFWQRHNVGDSLFLWPSSFVDPGVSARIWSSHLLRDKFQRFFEHPRGTLLESRSMGAPVKVGGVLSGHLLVGGLSRLLATLLGGSHLSPGCEWSGPDPSPALSPGQLRATTPGALGVPGLGGVIFLIIAILMNVKWVLLAGVFCVVCVKCKCDFYLSL